MEGLLQDLRYAVRSLSRSPVAAIAAVLCLGFGIGANTTMFGIVDRLLFRPPPYVRDATRVVTVLIARTYPGRPPETGGIGSFPTYLDLADGAGVFEAVAAFSGGSADLGRGVDAEQIVPRIVTHTFFPLLRVSPALGRFFGPDEDRVGGTPVVVLDYDFWQRRFAGDRTIIGKTLLISYNPYTVIGIAPRGFAGVGLTPPNVWLPASVAAPQLMFPGVLGNRGSFWTNAIARLKPGVTPEAAAAAATLAVQRGAATFGNGGQLKVVLAPLLAGRGPNPGSNVKIATWVAGVAAIVLLIACANVANLLLARAANRKREIAVRLALGVGRRRLMRQLLVEGLVLAGAGAAVAVLLALWGGSMIRIMILPNVTSLDMVFDVRVLMFTILVAIMTGVLCGLVPALQASQPDLTGALKAGRHGDRFQHSFTRSALLVMQVALTVTLLTGAGLFIRSLHNVQTRNLGYDVDHVVVATVDLKRAGYDSARAASFFDIALEHLRKVPGVTHVATSSSIPFFSASSMALRVPGLDSVPSGKSGGPWVNAVSPDYFDAVGRTILRGRAFTATDRPGTPRVVIIGETMARLYWRGESPLGKCVILGGENAPCSEVVGVAADAYLSVDEEENMTLYLPAAQAVTSQFFAISAIEIRTTPRASDIAGTVRREIQQLAANLPYVQATALEERVNPQYRSWRMGATMFGVFGGLALVLAAVGLYGVLTYLVTRRTHEVGIRMALGATAGDVMRLVVGQGLRVTVVGVLIGTGAALAGGKALASLLYGVTPRDPVALIAAPLTLLVVAGVASYLPARRATRVDPALALREE
jgi:predicted permease